ncbi:receptor-like protein kinase FERONIA isoform X1 [Vigna unguiculata]|uniref:receptor-like protein kinase FERONIA isoform X1 n=1 Tax=Vigna unguiculata TaxID=3917 RepID=UPI001016135D|nr:receptor-like protein kinase FERONIA isoform X1 [Vigna unguiculata]XP_027926920.1 receptor-like protein kinase FERONIA isoform X1 [Vigna unguiculata]
MFLNCLGRSCWKHTTNTNSAQRQFPTVIEELCHQFSLADLRKATNNFDLNRVIGSGIFSEVYKGYLQHNGASDYTVAIKRFNNQGCEAFNNEIELLCQLRHPRCVSLIGFCNHEKEKILVYEYMSNGSLNEHLQHGELSWKKRLQICIGVARGLHYLHTGAKRSIFHCILGPNTILLDDHMEPKLAGFGVSVQGSRFMSKQKQINVEHVMGTWGVMATQFVMDSTITAKWDVFSFGLVLLEVVCRGRFYLITLAEKEFLENPIEEKIDPIIKGKIAPDYWQVFVDVMVNCLKYEPDERPAIGEVEVQLEHALSMQEQADITNSNCDYTLLSKTIIPLGVKQYVILKKLSD